MQCPCSCQNSCSIHDYVVPTVVCTYVLYTLQWLYSYLVDRSEHCIHPGDTTHTHRQSQLLSSGSPTKNWTGADFQPGKFSNRRSCHTGAVEYLASCNARAVVQPRQLLPGQLSPKQLYYHQLYWANYLRLTVTTIKILQPKLSCFPYQVSRESKYHYGRYYM